MHEENHYRKLAVSYIPGSEQDEGPCNFEARFYDFNNLPPKQERYRLRSMGRLAARVVFRVAYTGCEIVIFRSGPSDEIKREAGTNPQPPSVEDIELQTGIHATRSRYSGMIGGNMMARQESIDR